MKKLIVASAIVMGGLASAQTSLPERNHSKGAEHPKMVPGPEWDRLQNELKLTPSQLELLHKADMDRRMALKDERKQIIEAKKSMHKAQKQERDVYQDQLKQILSPEQYSKYSDIKKAKMNEKRENFKSKHKNLKLK